MKLCVLVIFLFAGGLAAFGELTKSELKRLEELTARTPTPFSETVRLYHYYMYEDSDGEVTESISMKIRPVRKKAEPDAKGKDTETE